MRRCSSSSSSSCPLSATGCPVLCLQVALSKQSPYVKTSHRVSGLMLANNTGIRHLFNKIIRDYDKLVGGPSMNRRAFMEPYK